MTIATPIDALAGAGRVDERADSIARRAGSNSLRRRLVAVDAAGTAIAWALTLAVTGPWRPDGSWIVTAWTASAAAGAAVLLAGVHHLYLARVCATRSVEVALLGRVALLTGAAMLLVAGVAGAELPVPTLVGATVGMFLVLAIGRGAFGAWLRSCRASGRYVRKVALLGANDEARDLWALLSSQPDLGYEVVGVVSTRGDHQEWDWPVAWLCEPKDAPRLLAERSIGGAVLAVSNFSAQQRSELTSALLGAGVHVQVSSGLERVAPRRLRTAPIGREPLYYLEANVPTRAQLAVKRAVDLVIGGVSAVVALPILAVAMTAIRLGSKGPALYRQERLGRDGRPFVLYKLRTMVDGADQRLQELADANERTGPLFKLDDDPRVTKVGRFLRLTSIDELPQLWCVLTGSMSLVGPRPALVDEFRQFDDALRARTAVRPGITGLWQVEARDNPSFHAYRRLDLFYLANWSIGLDLAILFATAEAVLVRSIIQLRNRGKVAAPLSGASLAFDRDEATAS